MDAAYLRRQVKQGVIGLRDVAHSTTTSRDTLLALSELARRYGGDYPQVNSLSAHELRVLSQNGEDGVLAEIFRRSGAPGQSFVEIGAGTGAENNTAVLADAFGWGGLLLEADPGHVQRLRRKYACREDVVVMPDLVTPDNVEELLRQACVPTEVDLLSIDVDGSEYWIWEALQSWRPRLVVVEYNSALASNERLVQPKDHSEPWDGTQYGGASILALQTLGEAKGYRLAHTEMTGVNAFFVRADLPGEYSAPEAIMKRGPNHFLLSRAHLEDPRSRPYVDLNPT